MTDAPERIWLKPTYRQHYPDDFYVTLDGTGAEYILKEASDRERDAAVAAAYERAMDRLRRAAALEDKYGRTINAAVFDTAVALIRAMIPDKSRDALDAMLTEATAQGASDASLGMAVAPAEKNAENARLQIGLGATSANLAEAMAENARLRDAIREQFEPCRCHEGYASRGMADPSCPAFDHGDDLRVAVGEPPVCQYNVRIDALRENSDG